MKIKIYRSIGLWSFVFGMLIICNSANAACTKDTDCKGDRICEEGKCVNPDFSEPALERREDSYKKDIAGTWQFVANSYPGKIEFQRSSNGWKGRVWFDVHQRWEQLTDISFDPGTGSIQFNRPEAVQLHTGTLLGNKMKGTFAQHGSGSYGWEARTLSEPALERREDSSKKDITGIWQFVANSYPGKIEFQRSSNGWKGRVWFDIYQRWEQLTDISFDAGTGSIQFNRPEAVQLHTGTVLENKMKGTFAQHGAGSYGWEARK